MSLRMGSSCVALVLAALVSLGPAGLVAEEMPLAKPALEGEVSLEGALARRRSVRDLTDRPLEVRQVAQLLWAAQGITGDGGKRTAPSAGALYPLSLYLVVGKVKGLSAGIYRYKPAEHALVKIKGADHREALARACGGQRWVGKAPVSFVFAVNYGRMALYHERGRMFADMEMGHSAQNLLLQAAALGLGAVPVGSLRGGDARKILDLPEELAAQYVVPVGVPK